MMHEPKFDLDKFDAAAVYAIHRSVEKDAVDALSADKLACLLFMVDLDAYRRLGESVTTAMWCRGVSVPYPRDLGESYLRGLILSQMHLVGATA